MKYKEFLKIYQQRRKEGKKKKDLIYEWRISGGCITHYCQAAFLTPDKEMNDDKSKHVK